MLPSRRFGRFVRPSLSLALFWVLLASLWLAGGASRPDVLGQVVVRGAAWVLLVAFILWGRRPSFVASRAMLAFVFAAFALALIQLVPVPPAWWQSLPGRMPLADAVRASGQPLPWAQWSMSPSATLNAAGSLVIPFVTLIFVGNIEQTERRFTTTALLIFIGTSMVMGLLQFSTGVFDNIFVNETPGVISGTFANRNHFALLLAIGCVLTPVWAFEGRDGASWRTAPAAGLTLLFLLTLLATGSRAGLGLGMLGVLLGLLISSRARQRALRRYPSWVFPALLVGILAVIAIGVMISALAGRAEALDRLFAMDPGQDMRARGLPVVLDMIRAYLPLGTGLGTFDPVFRANEPLALLKPTYFNHAHNDILELVLTAGIPGLILLLAAMVWWLWASAAAWRGRSADATLPKLGSAILLLVFLASIFDYPARTPTIMAFMVIAGIWLSAGSSALPWKRRAL